MSIRAVGVMALILHFSAATVALGVVPAAGQAPSSAAIDLASQTAWVESDRPFVARVDIRDVVDPNALSLQLTVHSAVTSRSQFTRTLDGEQLGRRIKRVRLALEDVAFDANGAAPMTVDVSGLRPGVYPVAISILDGRADPLDTLYTHLVRVASDAAANPLSLSWILDLGADPAMQLDGSIRFEAGALDALRATAMQLDRSLPLTLRPTPETVLALQEVEGGLPVEALAERARDDEVLAAPFVDLDLRNPVAREGFIMQRAAGDAVLDELGFDSDPRLASVAGPLSPGVLSTLSSAGVTGVVVDEDALEPLDDSVLGGLSLARPFELDAGAQTIAAVAVDSGLSEHFEEEDAVLGAHHLLAELAVLHGDAPGRPRGLVVRPPAGWEPSSLFLDAALTGVESSPLLRPVRLSDLFDAVEPLRDRNAAPVVRRVAAAQAVPSAPRALAAARADVAALRSFAGPASEELREVERLLMLSMSADLVPAQAARYVERARARVAEAVGNVRLQSSASRLTARAGTLPITVTNENDFAVSLDLDVRSDKLAFVDQGRERLGGFRVHELKLDANQTITTTIQVRARTSGTSSLRAALQTHDGGFTVATSSMPITSTFASWVGPVLSVGAAVFLAAWWVHHHRKNRR